MKAQHKQIGTWWSSLVLLLLLVPQSYSHSILCNNGTVNERAFADVDLPGVDPIALDAITDLIEMEFESLPEWETLCQMDPKPAPEYKPDVSVRDGLKCWQGNKTAVLVPEAARKLGLENCTSLELQEIKPIIIPDGVGDSACLNGKPRLSLLDPGDLSLQSLKYKGLMGLGIGTALKIWEEECKEEDQRRLGYANWCGSYALVYKGVLRTSFLEFGTDNYFHWHFRNQRAMKAFPLLASATNAKPCLSASCTVATSSSCWPRPMFSDGFAWSTHDLTTYTCYDQNPDFIHVVGGFEGSLRLSASVRSMPSSNACAVSQDSDGFVTITSWGQKRFCNIFLDYGQSSYVLEGDSQIQRNICSGF